MHEVWYVHIKITVSTVDWSVANTMCNLQKTEIDQYNTFVIENLSTLSMTQLNETNCLSLVVHQQKKQY